ncbi:MAG: M12 family metallo-peptidase [Steroidobacteraceae bacterium]|jgi:hypothetical protein|nr:M12 family metallo-peptidase [Steroidobacteraceae bacterium]
MKPDTILARGLLALGLALAASPGTLAAGRGSDLRVLHHEAPRDFRTDRNGRPASFEAYGRRFELALERNERLRFVTAASLPGIEVLRGELTGLPNSWVRVTRTPAGLYGMFSDGFDVYVIEPAREVADRIVGPAAARGRDPVVYRLADTVMPADGPRCGTVSLAGAARGDVTGMEEFEAVSAELQAAIGASSLAATRQMAIDVVGDHEFSQLSFAGGLTPEQAIAARMNIVDGIFSSQVGVKLVVESVTVFRDPADPFTGTLTPSALLEEFGRWRDSTRPQRANGLSHLMTGRDLDGTTIGIAYIDALCMRRFGASLSQAASVSSTTATLVIAHELGHNFGAEHDGEGGSVCESTPQTFLMAPRVANSDQFSQCSLDTIAPSVATASCVVQRSFADASVDLPLPPRSLRGVAFDYGFSVRSVGELQVEGVTATITLPASLGFNSGSVQGGNACAASGATVTCTVGALAPGASRVITLNLTGQAFGSATANFALASGNDAVAGNNAGTAIFPVDPSADLAVSLSASPASFTSGGTSQVTATVRHLGGDTASDARLAFTIPAGLSVSAVSANALGCALAAGAVTCAATPLAASAVESVTLTVTGTEAGSRQVAASVGASIGDPASGNNGAQAQVEVRAAATGGGSGGSSGGSSSGGGGGGGAIDAGALLGLALGWLLALRRRGVAPVTAAGG